MVENLPVHGMASNGRRRQTRALLRQSVKDRDGNRCIKCGRRSDLEIHHIIPVYLGGKDYDFNMVTLCHRCHKDAPNEPVELIQYCQRKLPPDLDRAVQFTKLLTMILVLDGSIPKTIDDEQGWDYVNKRSEKLARDIWYSLLSDDINNFSNVMADIFKNTTKERKELNEL